jgi:hypothetical protein
MRGLAALFPPLLAMALAAGPALAAVGYKPIKKMVVPPPAAAPVLRGPLSAPVAPPQTQAQTVVLPPPGSSFAGLATGGLSAPPPITPLRAVGDPAPLCRASCAEARAVCASSDDAGCDSHWIQCVADCSAPVER